MATALSISPATITPAPPAPRGIAWLDVETAAKRSGMNPGSIRRACAAKWFAVGLAQQRGPKGFWHVREDADVRFSRVRFAEDLPADLKGLTDKHRRIVLAKVAIVNAWDSYTVDAVRRGQSRDMATQCFLEEMASGLLPGARLIPGLRLPSSSTLYNWRAAYRAGGMDGLIDERGTRQSKSIADDPFFEVVKFYLMDQRQRTKRLCWELACKQAQIDGFMPRSYKQTLRFIAQIPHQVFERYRKGPKAADGTSSRYIERDYSKLKSNEEWCCDEHTFDVWVKHRGDLVRPYLTAFEDMRSRKIVGFIITPKSADTDAVLAALHRGCASHGVPERIYADNGKIFDCAALSGQTKQMRFGKIEVDAGVMAGVLGGLGITIKHAIAFNAKAKPIERFFGTLCDRFSKLQATYCGSNPKRRPENLKAKLKRDTAPEFDDFVAAFELWLEGDYHTREHHGDSMNGKTPAMVFAECLVEKQTAPAAVLEVMLWKPTHPTRCTRNGVLCDGIGYGNRSDALIPWTGKDVIVRVNPGDAGQAAICEPSGRLICFAPANVKLPFNTSKAQLKEASAELARSKKQERDAYTPRPRAHQSVEHKLYADRAEAQRKAAVPASPDLKIVNTPISDQLPALERGLGITEAEPMQPQPSQMMLRFDQGEDVAHEPDAFSLFMEKVSSLESGAG